MIEYREITEHDIPTIVELYAKYLNSGESISQSIRDAWRDGDYMGYMALYDGKPAGFFTLRNGLVFTYPHPALEAEVAKVTAGKRLAFCDALLALPEYRIDGIAHELAAKSRELLREKGHEYSAVEIWIYPNGRSPAKEVFETVGKVVWQKRV